MHISVDTCSTGAPAEPALRRPGGRLSFGLHHAHTRVPEAPPVSGSFCRQAEEAGIGERARETITVGGSSPQAYVTDRPRRAPQPSRPIVLLGDVMLHPRILKFGGTSVADAAAVERVTGVVRSHGGPRPVVVVSALAGVTDALLTAADAAADGDPRATAPSLDALLERHRRRSRHPPPAPAPNTGRRTATRAPPGRASTPYSNGIRASPTSSRARKQGSRCSGSWRRRGARSSGCSTASSRSRTGERHCGARLRRTASACRRRSWRRH